MKNTSEKCMQMSWHCLSQAPTVKKLILLWANLYEPGYELILVPQVLTAKNALGPRHPPLRLRNEGSKHRQFLQRYTSAGMSEMIWQ